MLIFTDENFILLLPQFGSLLVEAKPKSGANMTPRIHGLLCMLQEQLRIKWCKLMMFLLITDGLDQMVPLETPLWLKLFFENAILYILSSLFR